MSIRRIILVPGLLEPCVAMWPLKRSLQKHCERVECFRDRLIFRNLDRSVDRLASMLCEGDQEGSIGLVAHSFGDWVARQAIARATGHHVSAMVSLAPAMRPGILLHGLRLVTGNLIPEVAVIMKPDKAMANVRGDDSVRRLVLWAKVDASVRAVQLDHFPRLRTERVLATHLSIILQPNVLKIVSEQLFHRT